MQVVKNCLAAVLVPIAASAIILGMAAVAGGRLSSGGAPFPDVDDGAAVTCVDEAVRPVGRAPIDGRARLCFSWTGIQATVDLDHLPNEVAYTAWLAYFGQPAVCSTSPCGGADPARADEGLVERIDTALPDVAGRASLTRIFREIHPNPGSEIQILIFQRGVLGRVLPSDRVRVLIEWPLSPARQMVAADEDGHIGEPLVGRTVIRMLEVPQTSELGRRTVGT